MSSPKLKNSNKELSAVGATTFLIGLVYAIFAVGNLGGFVSGPLLAVLTAAVLWLVLTVGGLGVLWRASWGWSGGLTAYALAIGVQGWSVVVRGILVYTAVLLPLLLGCGLYLMLSREEFTGTTRPSDPGRPNYR